MTTKGIRYKVRPLTLAQPAYRPLMQALANEVSATARLAVRCVNCDDG